MVQYTYAKTRLPYALFAAALLIVFVNAAPLASAQSPFGNVNALQTCELYGIPNYTNNWISINFIVILTSLTVIAFVYAIANVLPTKMRSRLVDAIRSELSQVLLSAVIIGILIGSAQLACDMSASYSQSLGLTQLTPFQYADSYIGNLATNTGISLLTNLYSYSVAYEVEGITAVYIMNFTASLLGGVAGDLLSGSGGAAFSSTSSSGTSISLTVYLPAIM